VDEDGRAFKFRHPVAVRFKDIDVGGHAHHSHALVYFEEARWGYWQSVVGRGGTSDVGYILAEATVRYHKRVLWPAVLDVGVSVTRLGKKHFEMAYEVLSLEGERLVSGSTVQVWYDYTEGRSSSIPADVRAALEAHEGPFEGSRGTRPAGA
jgi:acyl-CoA thioester hydrolase